MSATDDYCLVLLRRLLWIVLLPNDEWIPCLLREQIFLCRQIFSCNLWWSLVIESTNGSVVHNSAEVRGRACARLARVHTIVVLTSLAHMTVLVHLALAPVTARVSVTHRAQGTRALTRVSTSLGQCSLATGTGLTGVGLLNTLLLGADEPVLTVRVHLTLGATS